MLRVTIICMGRLHENFWAQACSEYIKRLSRFCTLSVRELEEASLGDKPSKAQIDAALCSEGRAIESEIPKGAYTVVLAVEGRQLSSPELAEKLAQVSQSDGRMCFIIGSSHGLSPQIKSHCDLSLSFSKMTFPHQLFRVLLLEQLYRAFTINAGLKYHK